MAQTMKEFRNSYAAALKKREECIQKGEAARKRVEELKTEVLTAAKNGDERRFKALRGEIAEAEDDILFNEKYAETLNGAPFSKEDALEVWNHYVSSYNKAFSDLKKTYDKQLKVAANTFKEMCKLQEEAVKNKLFCGKACGITVGLYDARFTDLSDFKMETIDTDLHLPVFPRYNNTINSVTLKHFVNDGCITMEEAADLGKILFFAVKDDE